MEGGKVLASGTYGCILKPALPCKGESERPDDTVSKLMTTRNAEAELKEVKKVFRKVKQIHNYKNFYILDKIKMCEPRKLQQEDLKDFDRKCTAMKRIKIDSRNVNQLGILDNLRILQLPDGGKDIYYYFSNKHSPALYVKVNNAIIKLLKGGIVPLDGINVLHMDVKSSNIVYSTKTDKARLIDWGLTTNIVNNKIPRHIRGWPIMFNQPLTNLVFHKEIQKIFTRFQGHQDVKRIIKDNPTGNLKELLLLPLHQTFMNIIFKDDNSVKYQVGGLGHIEYWESIFKDIVGLNFPGLSPTLINSVKQSPFKTVGRMVSYHISKAFLEYSIYNNQLGTFRENDFFNQVFRHNCDVFGFISNYVDILKNKNLSASVRGKGYYIVEKYMIEPTYATVAFPLEEVVHDCHSLNNDLMPGVRHSPPKSIEQPKAPIMISQSENLRPDEFSWELTKRCPKGTHRNKKTGKCQKKITISKKKKCPPGSVLNRKTGRCNKIKPTQTKKKKRCKNGTRRNPKTGNCEPK